MGTSRAHCAQMTAVRYTKALTDWIYSYCCLTGPSIDVIRTLGFYLGDC